MKRRILALLAALLCSTTVAKADFAFTVGSGQTGFSFTASTGGTALCAATVTHCFASVPINTAGAAFFTSGNPGLVTLTGTNNIATVTTVTGVTTVSTVTTLSTLTGGGVASGAADSGNPIKIGGKYNSSPITLTDGNRGDLQLDVNGYAKVNVTNANTNGQKTMANSSPVVIASDQSNLSLTPYPITAVPYTATATGTTGATTATLAGAASVTTYLCGFSIRANATAAATGNATVTGVITATLNFTQWTAPNASGLGITEMIFSPCIPASGTNQSIAVVSAAPGTGGVVSVTAWGYKL